LAATSHVGALPHGYPRRQANEAQLAQVVAERRGRSAGRGIFDHSPIGRRPPQRIEQRHEVVVRQVTKGRFATLVSVARYRPPASTSTSTGTSPALVCKGKRPGAVALCQRHAGRDRRVPAKRHFSGRREVPGIEGISRPRSRQFIPSSSIT